MTSTNADPKSALRKSALARRAALPVETQDAFSRRLTKEGLRLALDWGARTVSAFHPIRGEPDTVALLAALSEAGVTTALPVVVGRDLPLVFRLWRPGEPGRAGPMGILEPLEVAREVEPDLLFVPLACFDRRGHRIGYGAGYYDRSLARLRARKLIRAVGVAYGVCEVASVPYEAHDQTLDAVVTERDTIFFGGR